MSEESFEIDILPTGEIRFNRSDPLTNEEIAELLSAVAPEKAEEIKRFLAGANSIEHLLGDEPLCG